MSAISPVTSPTEITKSSAPSDHDELGEAPADRLAQRRERGRERERDQQQEADRQDQTERQDARADPAAHPRHELARAPDLFERRFERREHGRCAEQQRAELTIVAIVPSAVCELRIASSRISAVDLPNSAVSCALRWP